MITGCEGSVVTFWDLKTGRQAQHVTEAHGTEEISCMSMDPTGRRLMTGDRTGNIHVWNASNGHLLNKLEPVDENEVTGIISLPDKSKIITVGWNRKILVYYDDNQTFCLRPNVHWKGGQLHQDDILTAAFCPPNYLATASFDGDIILWSLDREKMIRRLKKGSGSLLKAKVKKLGLLQNRKNLGSNYGSPVDKLLFLTSRAQWKSQESAILVSSEAGMLEFWCLYGPNRPMGRFTAATDEDSNVLALATDPSNEMLITGDSSGHITVWDISSYCISRAESIIAQVWSTTQRAAGNPDDNPEGKPPQLTSWHGHQDSVVSVEYLSRSQGALLLSASKDCTARLWTLDGQYIGMFGQKRLWNIDDPSSYRHAGKTWDEERDRGKKKTHVHTDLSYTSSKPPSPAPALSPKQQLSTSPSTREPPPPSKSTPTTPVAERVNFLPTIDVGKVGDDESEAEDPYSWRMTDYYRSMTSLVLERSSKSPQSWSILGDHYNKDFRRRMETRQTRRDHVGNVDPKLTCGGGFGSTCSPFQALHIPDTKEYELPKNMPVTSRMGHKTSRSSADPLWMTVRQGTLPPLAGVLRKDSHVTLAAESASGNASQFSFAVQ